MDFKSKEYRYSLILSFVVPFVASLRSANRLLAFIDTATFLGLFLTMIGVINNLRLHGSFDAIGYTFRRGFNVIGKTNYFDQDITEYVKNCKEERSGKKNVILSVGLTLLIFSIIMSFIYMNS